jgi:hypothetical protein
MVAADFPGAASLSSFYTLNVNGNDASTNSRTLSSAGSPTFVNVGFFGNENVLKAVGTGGSSTGVARTGDSVFDINLASGAGTIGGWFQADWPSSTAGVLIAVNSFLAGSFLLRKQTANLVQINASAAQTNSNANVNWPSGTWHHLVAVINAGTGSLYLDGQFATTITGLTGTGTAGTLTVGHEIGPGGGNNIVAQQVFHTQQALTAAQINNIYSKRFKGQQLAGGHVLQADSFPLVSLTNKAAFWSLAANPNDGSVNAKNLTNSGSVPFTGLGLFGEAGAAELSSSKVFQSTDSFFNTGNGVSFSCGAWFRARDWNPATGEVLMSNSPASGDRAWAISTNSSGGLHFIGTNTAGSNDTDITGANLALVDGSWHHVIFSYSFTSAMIKVYVDGLPYASAALANIRSLTSSLLYFGVSGLSVDANYFVGTVREAFFIKNYELTDADIRKLFSARVDLTGAAASVIAASQRWDANLLSEDGLGLSDLSGQAFVVDKSPAGKVWMDFGGASTNDPATRVNLKLSDSGLGATTVPVRKFQRSFVAAITDGTTIVHSLPSAPTNFSILHNSAADGKYKPLDAEGYIRADGTNIYLDGFGALTIDATRDLIVIASCGVPAIGIDVTTLANQVRYTAVKIANYTAATWEKVLTDSAAGAFTVTLPPTPAVGDTVEVYDGTESWGAFNVTLGRNGSNINSLAADFVCNVAGKAVKAVYISSAQGWRIYA